MKALCTAKNERANIRAEKATRRAIKQNTPPEEHYKLKNVDKIYVCSELREKSIPGLSLVEVKD